jgi:hypothetical protein
VAFQPRSLPLFERPWADRAEPWYVCRPCVSRLPSFYKRAEGGSPPPGIAVLTFTPLVGIASCVGARKYLHGRMASRYVFAIRCGYRGRGGRNAFDPPRQCKAKANCRRTCTSSSLSTRLHPHLVTVASNRFRSSPSPGLALALRPAPACHSLLLLSQPSEPGQHPSEATAPAAPPVGATSCLAALRRRFARQFSWDPSPGESLAVWSVLHRRFG